MHFSIHPVQHVQTMLDSEEEEDTHRSSLFLLGAAAVISSVSGLMLGTERVQLADSESYALGML